MQEPSPPLAPPYDYFAGLRREEMVTARKSDLPRHVYHLCTLYEEAGEVAIPQLVRTYSDYNLARLDGYCWIAEMQRKQGAKCFMLSADEEYYRSSGERCFRVSTPPRLASQWGIRLSVWTIESVLY